MLFSVNQDVMQVIEFSGTTDVLQAWDILAASIQGLGVKNSKNVIRFVISYHCYNSDIQFME